MVSYVDVLNFNSNLFSTQILYFTSLITVVLSLCKVLVWLIVTNTLVTTIS